MIADYFDTIRSLVASSLIVRAFHISYEQRSDEIGFLRGDLYFVDGSLLHFREYVRQRGASPAERYTYAYHYPHGDGQLVFRYDNADHFPDLSSFPHHKHVGAESIVEAASAPDLAPVLSEIESQIRLE